MAEPWRDVTRWRRELLHDIARLDWSRLDTTTGVRAALFVVTPMMVGAATGNLLQGLYATVGANFLVNTEGSGPNATKLKILAAACLIEPVAMALGTLTGSTGLLAVPLVSLGVFLFLLAKTSTSWAQVALVAAVVFVVGVGLPGATVSDSVERLWTLMAGDVWVLLGIAFQRSRQPPVGTPGGPRVAPQDSRHLHPFLGDLSQHPEVLGQAFVTAIAAAIGLAIGIALHLPRDIWIMVTIIIAIRPGIGPTINSTIVLAVGTVFGAMIAAAVTLEVTSLFILAALLFLFAFGMFASRFVNQALFQALVTPFLIVLLNIIYPGDWWFAFARIADVAVGGVVAVLVVYLHYLELSLVGSRGQAHVTSR